MSAAEYGALPLRAHAFLADVPLHDVWAVDLPRPHQRVTFAEFDPLRRWFVYPAMLDNVRTNWLSFV